MGNERNREVERNWERRREGMFIYIFIIQNCLRQVWTFKCAMLPYILTCVIHYSLLTTAFSCVMRCSQSGRRKYLIISELVTVKWLPAKIKLH